MWEKLIETIKTVFNLSKDLEQNRAEIKELRSDVNKLTHALQHFAHQVELIRQTESRERENLRLELENELLKFRIALPVDEPSAGEKRKKLPARSAKKVKSK